MRRRDVASALTAILLLAGSPLATAHPADRPGGAGGPGGPAAATTSDVGTWSVSATGPDTWTVAWQAPDPLPVTSDRPTIVTTDELAGVPAGVPLGVPTVAADGRTVEVDVVAAQEPAVEALDVVLSGQVLDESAPAAPASGPASRWQEPTQELLAVDPGKPGDLAVTTSDYARRGLAVPGMRADVEMVGHVVEPAVADPSRPLVLFLHGRHAPCYNPGTKRMVWRWPCAAAQQPVPSHLGYDYVQRVLASQGYVTVSIAANGINGQDGSRPDGGAAARSQLIQAHLDQWARWAGGRHEFDPDSVVLVGHSRGGEGASRASLEIPLTAPYTVAGQVLIGPTNFSRQTTPYVPTVAVLPSCDGDVIDLQGQTYTDVARGLADGDTAMKSSVMAVGANHNYFNTEWTPGLAAAPALDDWDGEGGVCGAGTGTRLTAAEQRRVGRAYVAGAVHLFGDGDQDYAPMFDGSPVRVRSTRGAVVLSHMVGGDRTMVVPGADAGLSTPDGARTVLCEGTTPWSRTSEPLCGRYARAVESTPHWPTAGSLIPTSAAFQMSWQEAGGRGGLALGTPLDLTGTDRLDLRTVVDPRVGDVTVRVRLTDADGGQDVVDPVGGRLVPALPTGDRWLPGKYWAQTLRVDTAGLAGIDPSEVVRVELVGTSDAGRLWVLDLAAASATLPPVPAERVPIVDVGELEVDEGGNGTHVARIPFTVTGDVPGPASFRIYAFGGEDGGAPLQLDVDVPAGGGTFDWEYSGDELDSFAEVFHELIGHATRNVMLRDNQGTLVVLDDDPAPELSLRPVRSRVQEGDDVELEATLSFPSGKESAVGLRVVRGDGSEAPVRASDVTPRWLRTWTDWMRGTDPALHRLELTVLDWFEPGRTTLVLRIPLRDDDRREPRESLTVRAVTDTGERLGPVTVHVPAGD